MYKFIVYSGDITKKVTLPKKMSIYIKMLLWHALIRSLKIQVSFSKFNFLVFKGRLIEKMLWFFLVSSGLPFLTSLVLLSHSIKNKRSGYSSKWNDSVAYTNAFGLYAGWYTQINLMCFHGHQQKKKINHIITITGFLSLHFIFKWMTLMVLRDQIFIWAYHTKCVLSLSSLCLYLLISSLLCISVSCQYRRHKEQTKIKRDVILNLKDLSI